jgi:malate dehydrogenase (oxaloacetate-decarboxylating)(NADP+)
MGIPIGKLALYVACGGVHPALCLPVTLDVGTDSDPVRNDPSYLGVRQRRLTGEAYDELVEEFVSAAQEVFPGVLLQFEDFATPNAFRLLARYRHRLCAFNDDIQGTGAMALAGLCAAQRLTRRRLTEERVLFFCAGSANIGIAQLLVAAMVKAGLWEEQARLRCWFMDSKGLVVKERAELAEHKRPFAHDCAPLSNLLAAVEAIRPTVLIGASGAPGAFDAPVLAAMARLNERPVIFALSNPTSKAECTAEDVYLATQGRAIFASGSPFPPVAWEHRTIMTGQANNSYIFPGLGLGVLAARATRVSEEMFFAAAQALAAQTTTADLASGRLFPAASSMREVAAAVAAAVAEVAYSQGYAGRERPVHLADHVCGSMYWPCYPDQRLSNADAGVPPGKRASGR